MNHHDLVSLPGEDEDSGLLLDVDDTLGDGLTFRGGGGTRRR